MKDIRKTGALLIMGILLAVGISPALQNVDPFVGDWTGMISIPEAEIDIACHFKMDADGELTGTMDSPSQGAFDLMLMDVEIKDGKISFGIDDPNVPGDPRFSGVLDEAGTSISGDFSQGGSSGTFELTKETS